MSTSPLKAKLDAVHARREQRDGGFTLIELLVVVVIIGILVAIAIPLYLQYQNGAKNKSAESDLRGAISAVETYYGNNNNTYPATPATVGAAGDVTLGAAPNQIVIKVGSGNTVNYVAGTGSYQLCSTNSDGGHVFYYNSANGGSVQDKGKGTMDTSCVFTAGT
jgi:type IV pilus assembly protein PilA